jgi:hypothetical protein
MCGPGARAAEDCDPQTVVTETIRVVAALGAGGITAAVNGETVPLPRAA